MSQETIDVFTSNLTNYEKESKEKGPLWCKVKTSSVHCLSRKMVMSQETIDDFTSIIGQVWCEIINWLLRHNNFATQAMNASCFDFTSKWTFSFAFFFIIGRVLCEIIYWPMRHISFATHEMNAWCFEAKQKMMKKSTLWTEKRSDWNSERIQSEGSHGMKYSDWKATLLSSGS